MSPWRNPFTLCPSLFMFKTMCSECFQFYPAYPLHERINPARCGERLWPPCGMGWGWPELGHIGVKPMGSHDGGSGIHSPLSISSLLLPFNVVTARTGSVTVPERRGGNLAPLSSPGNRGRVSFPEHLRGSSSCCEII